MNTIERFKSGRINIRGTIFTTLATVSKHDKTYGYHFVRVDEVYKSLNSQGFIISRENVNACIRDMKRLGQLVEIDKGSYYWGIDPVPFKAKEDRNN